MPEIAQVATITLCVLHPAASAIEAAPVHTTALLETSQAKVVDNGVQPSELPASPLQNQEVNLVQRVVKNLSTDTPQWLGRPDQTHYARFLVRHYERNNALAELYALTAAKPSTHYKALFTKLSAYELLRDARYFCVKPESAQDYAAAAYLLWLHGDLQKPSWNLLKQAQYACDPATQHVGISADDTTSSNPDLAAPPTTRANAVYGDELDAAIMSFQQRHNLTSSGNLDPETLVQLSRSPDDLVKQLRINLTRMRELNKKLGERYLLANIPAFQAEVFDNNKSVLRLNTIVGKTSRPTPQFSSELTNVVVNPSWNVPKKLVYKDLIPKQMKDSDYLSSRGIGIYADTTGAVALDPASLDWKALRWNFPYHMRQAPGPRNALGRYKFITPNPRAIFMHDTNSRKLFSKEVRTFSSGCVRLENPDRLVEYLLRYQGSENLLSSLGRLKATKWIALKDKLPVHYVYWTAWIDDRGLLQLRNDVYQQDSVELEKLQFAAR